MAKRLTLKIHMSDRRARIVELYQDREGHWIVAESDPVGRVIAETLCPTRESADGHFKTMAGDVLAEELDL